MIHNLRFDRISRVTANISSLHLLKKSNFPIFRFSMDAHDSRMLVILGFVGSIIGAPIGGKSQ